MKRHLSVNLCVLCVFICCVLLRPGANASTEVIYYDNFSGLSSQGLHGTSPDTDLAGGNTWIANSSWKADGTAGQNSMATLSFVPQSGCIYRLSVTFKNVIGNDYWLALGYTSGSSTASGSRFITSPAGNPWMLRRGNASLLEDGLFLGPGTAGGKDFPVTLDRSQDVSFQILLDTRNPQWGVVWSQKLTSNSDYTVIDRQTYTTNPAIAAIGVASGGTTVTGQLGDFLLERIQTSLSIDSQSADIAVNEGQSVLLEVAFNSASVPTAVWRCIKKSQDQAVDENDPDITLTLNEYSPGKYKSVLGIKNTTTSDEGYYYCILNNSDNYPTQSRQSLLKVNGRSSHWPLGTEGFSAGRYLDTEGHHDADVTGSPIFTAGNRGIADSAVEITPQTGWASASDVTAVGGETGAFSISLWCRWNGRQVQVAGPPLGTLMMENIWAGTSYVEQKIETGGQWQHVCVTFDGLFGKIYVDGQLQITNTWQSPQSGGVTVEIGHMAGGQTFNGAIDDIRIYNYALSELQVGSIYSRQGDCTLAYASKFDYTGPYGVPDCIVNLYDVMVFIQNWLSCGIYPECQ